MKVKSTTKRIVTIIVVFILFFGICVVPASEVNALTYSDTVYRTPKGKRYHKSTCPSIQSSKLTAVTVSQAMELGLTACNICLKGTNPQPEAHVHSLKKVPAKAATCTEGGNSLHWKCSSCGRVFLDSQGKTGTTIEKVTTKATGHKWDGGKITRVATTTAAGVKTYTCTVCKTTKTESIPKLLPGADKIRRLYGLNRYETAYRIADEYMKDSGQIKLKDIIVVSGENYPDALSASYLAKVKKAPIILWRAKENKNVQEYIKKNLQQGGYVYLIGGPTIVGKEVASGMRSYKFVRIYGKDRYETNAKVLIKAGVKKLSGIDIGMICDGTSFQQALIASSTGHPIILAKKTGITKEQRSLLAGTAFNGFQCLMNMDELPLSFVKSFSVFNFSKMVGFDYVSMAELSVLIAKAYHPESKEVILASDTDFPDGLCGGTLALVNKAPILLINNKNYNGISKYTKRLSLAKVTVLGGPTIITDQTAVNIM